MCILLSLTQAVAYCVLLSVSIQDYFSGPTTARRACLCSLACQWVQQIQSKFATKQGIWKTETPCCFMAIMTVMTQQRTLFQLLFVHCDVRRLGGVANVSRQQIHAIHHGSGQEVVDNQKQDCIAAVEVRDVTGHKILVQPKCSSNFGQHSHADTGATHQFLDQLRRAVPRHVCIAGWCCGAGPRSLSICRKRKLEGQ